MTDMLPGKSNSQSGFPHNKKIVPTITCHICQAIYAPREGRDDATPPTSRALETTFMSMCHFCFRCRRPACPECWDTIHGICGECGLEAELPFRTPAALLRGVLFPPRRQAQLRRKRTSPAELICIQPGRFQKMAPIEEAETRPIQSTLPKQPGPHHPLITRRHSYSAETESNSITNTSLTGTLRRQFRNPPPSRFPIPPARPRVPHPQSIVTVSQTNGSSASSSQHHDPQSIPTQGNTHITIEDIKTRPKVPDQSQMISTKKFPPSTKKHRTSLAHQVEVILTWMLLSLLIVLMIVIVTAFMSQDANLFILRTVHINIHDELTYLWHLITQIHF